MSQPLEVFLAHLSTDAVLGRRIELACEQVGFDAALREIRRIARDAGLPMDDDLAAEVLDRLAGG